MLIWCWFPYLYQESVTCVKKAVKNSTSVYWKRTMVGQFGFFHWNLFKAVDFAGFITKNTRQPRAAYKTPLDFNPRTYREFIPSPWYKGCGGGVGRRVDGTLWEDQRLSTKAEIVSKSATYQNLVDEGLCWKMKPCSNLASLWLVIDTAWTKSHYGSCVDLLVPRHVLHVDVCFIIYILRNTHQKVMS